MRVAQRNIDQQFTGAARSQSGVKVQMQHRLAPFEPAGHVFGENPVRLRRSVTSEEEALREVVLSGGDGLSQRGHPVTSDRPQRLERERLPYGWRPTGIEEPVEACVAFRTAGVLLSFDQEVAVQIDVLLVEPSVHGEAIRIETVQQQTANIRDGTLCPLLEQCQLDRRSERSFDTMHTAGENERSPGVRARRRGDIERECLTTRAGHFDGLCLK